MRLMLTGASGFLGRHLVRKAAGRVLVRVTRASEAIGPDEAALGPGPWNRAHFAEALVSANPDVVIHCAGIVHSDSVGMYFQTNVALAAELLEAVAAAPRPPRVILIGSAAEYGLVSPDAQPVSETYPCRPRTNYAVSKYAQSLLGFASVMRGLQVLVARLFNPVGFGMPARLALPSFARQITSAAVQPIVSVGDLSVERDFLDVEEVSRVLLALADLPEWPWPLVNLCSGKAYRLGDLLDELIAMSGRRVQIRQDPTLVRDGDMRSLVGDTSRLSSISLLPDPPDFEKLLAGLLAEARASSN